MGSKDRAAKRKHEVIDLVSGDSDDNTRKSQRLESDREDERSTSHGHGGHGQAYQTPPSSNTLPSSSQASRQYLSNSNSYNTPQSSNTTRNSSRGQQSGAQLDLEAERDSWLAEDDGGANDLLTTSQDYANGSEELVLYGDISTKIVGVRFYNGNANCGEQVLMRREPRNPYDSNAIRVENVGGVQIGHIPRNMAEKLAKYMDGGIARCEGQLDGSIGEFVCPLTVSMFGPDPQSQAGKELAENMTKDKFSTKAMKDGEKERKKEEKRRLDESRRAAAMGNGARLKVAKNSTYANQSGPGDGESDPIMEAILEASQRFSPREIGKSTDNYGMQEDMLKNMPMADKPAAIKTEMLPYQLQALKWLLDQEDPQLPTHNSEDVVQLWKRADKNRNMFTNIATTYTVQQHPTLASGGLLCDDMGLGKTLEMIALMVADNEKSGRKGTTLIISPLSVMSNWSGQIATHIHEDKMLKVYTYHGSGRNPKMMASDFGEYDVVISTYQTLASDFFAGNGKSTQTPSSGLRKTGLYSVEWRRIILDEGHSIRNPQSKGAAAVTGVKTKSRWALTGTPIVNSLKDLYCLLRFIGITGGLENLEIFNRVLVRPLKGGDKSAGLLLQAIMTAFTLRRRKEMKFIDLRLPKLDEYVHRIEFTSKERERYEAFNAEAKGLLKGFPKKDGTKSLQAYAHLLEILLRMRQCCNHWQLCSKRVTNLMSQLAEQKTVDLTPENQNALQDLLQVSIQSHEECPICIDTLHNPVITPCAHVFGLECISRVIETQHKCPMCRAELKDDTCLVYPAHDAGDEETDDEMELNESSTKLDSMMKILSATRSKGKEKTVVFSQWTRFLDIVQARLDREGYTYCRLDGTMKAPDRDEALQSFEHNQNCTIMLASLGVCAVGLNLTAANQVVLSDTWWAPAIEDQAIDRVHRLGQKKPTRVFRLVMDGTIEDRTLDIQKDKRRLMQLAFGEKGGKREHARAGRLADIEKLLGGG